MITFLTKKNIAAVMFVLCAGAICAQNTFFKVYPTVYDKTSRDVLETADGGYILCGMTNNSTINDCDLYVMKTDGAGNFLWDKTFGGVRVDYAYSMIESYDGNYMIVGYSQSFSGGDMDVYLLKINPTGSLIWQKTYIGWGNEEGRGIIKTGDGNFLIVGSTTSNLPNQDAFLMKIDPDGSIIWIKYYGGSDKEYGNSVVQSTDGGYYMLGETFSYGSGGDAYLVKTNNSGDVIWTRYFGGALNDEGVWVESNGDGSCVIAVRDSCNGMDVDVRVMKVSSDGNVVWSKLYAGAAKDTPKTLRAMGDGYIVGAISRSFGWYNPDMWLLRINASGDTLWSRHYGDADHEHCHHAKVGSDGSLLAIGHSRSYSPGQKIMFLKLDASGLVGIEEQMLTAKSLQAYPNPSADGKFSFSPGVSGPCHLNVYNSLGEAIYSAKHESLSSGDVETVKLSCDKGVYILTLESQGRKRACKLVIK